MLKVKLGIFFWLCYFGLQAQFYSVGGKLTDSLTGDPLSYASVYFKQSFFGTLSNLEGEFFLENDPDFFDDSLVVSLIGYETQIVPPGKLVDSITIALVPKTYALKEVVILPKPAEYYVMKAGENIPVNYASKAFNSTVYYRELLKENGEFSHFLEAIMNAYNKAYNDTVDSNQLSIATSKIYEDVADIQFMHKRIEKENKKAKKKAEKEGKEFDEDEDGFAINMGNPVFLFNYNLLRTRRSFFRQENMKKYEFILDGVIESEGMNMLVISFDQRPHVKEALFKGKMYLEEESLAVVSLEYSYSERGKKYLFPKKVSAAMWVLGLRVEEPYLDVTIRSSKKGDLWVLDDILLSADAILEKRHLFKENERSMFDAEIFLSVVERELDRADKIPVEKQVKIKPAFKKQLTHDPENPLWDRYLLMKPERFLEKF